MVAPYPCAHQGSAGSDEARRRRRRRRWWWERGGGVGTAQSGDRRQQRRRDPPAASRRYYYGYGCCVVLLVGGLALLRLPQSGLERQREEGGLLAASQWWSPSSPQGEEGLGDAALASSSSPAPPRGLTVRSFNQHYGDVPSMKLYPWDLIAEPFRRTTFAVVEDVATGHALEWELTFLVGEGGLKENLTLKREISKTIDDDASLQDVLLEIPGAIGLLKVSEFDESGSAVAQGKFSVACKYVRREIRSLTDDDRESFLNALQAIHRLGLKEGRELYGDNFANYEYFVVKHLARMTLDGYSPFHSGQSFLTSHFAFGLEIERSLQAVDPTIALPYWDYTIDSVAYGSDWHSLSPLFREDWLGAYEEGHYWTRGRWAFLPVPVSFTSPEHNAYGIVTDSINADSVPFVGRSASMCGLETRALLPGCKEVQGSLFAPDLQQFHSRVEFGLHGMLHGAVGGYWDCPQSLGELAKKHPSWAPALEGIALQANTLWRSAAIRKRLTVCPLGPCERTDSCTCMNPELDALPEGRLPYEKAMDLLQGASVLDMLAANPWLEGYVQVFGLDPHHKVPGQPVNFTFSVGSDDENRELTVWLTRFLAHPPKMSPFATPLAAPNDPIFGPSHVSWIRAWDARLLSGGIGLVKRDQDPGSIDLTWTTQSDTWIGHNLRDVLPFKGLIPGEADPEHYYTNEELLSAMDPRNPALPYVHDSLNWLHCESILPKR